MSNYPVWWETTITIYNRYEDAQTNIIRWFKHTVEGAFWKNVGNKVTVGEVTIDSSNTICRIREDSKFKEPYEWVKLPNDEKPNFFTLGRGDIIIKGMVDDEIDEYTKGQRSSNLLSKYKALQGCMQIENVGINTGQGRNNPHYYVSGT